MERFSDDAVLPGVRAAIAFGPLLVRDGDYFGPIVNLAARATKLAAPGGVVATEEVRAAVPDAVGIDFEVMAARELKGFDEAVTLYAVTTASVGVDERRHPWCRASHGVRLATRQGRGDRLLGSGHDRGDDAWWSGGRRGVRGPGAADRQAHRGRAHARARPPC